MLSLLIQWLGIFKRALKSPIDCRTGLLHVNEYKRDGTLLAIRYNTLTLDFFMVSAISKNQRCIIWLYVYTDASLILSEVHTKAYQGVVRATVICSNAWLNYSVSSR